MGRGGKGKHKKSRDWYEIKLMGRLPIDDLLHIVGTGMSKQDIHNFFNEKLGLGDNTVELSDLIDDAKAVRNVSNDIVDDILKQGIKHNRIKHRLPFKGGSETARFGYYYKTSNGVEWIKNIREFRIKQKKL